MKSAARGHSTLGSIRFLMTRPALHRFNPQRGAYFLSLLKAVFRAKSVNGQRRAGGRSGLMRGCTKKKE